MNREQAFGPPSRLRDCVCLLDANNLAMRSFHAAKNSMTSHDGTETGSLQLFAASLAKYLAEIQPTHFVACWDGGDSQFRMELYPQYKQARRALHPSAEPGPHAPGFRLIREFLTLTGLAQWRQEGVEADDLIAAAWRRHRDTGRVVILSSDHDLLQLLDANTTQYRFSSYGAPTDVWGHDRVVSDLGYTPEQVPLVLAFKGDLGDGVPGAKGIGPVKALKILRANDWVFDRALLSVADDQVTMVQTSLALVDLLTRDHCEVEAVPEYRPLTRFSPDAVQRFDAVTDFCARYQLSTLWDRFANGRLW